MKHVRSFSDVQLKDEFDKIRHAAANLLSQHLRRSLKRQGAYLEQPDSKKSKSTEPQKTFVPAASRPSSAGVTPDVHHSPFVDTPPATPAHSPKASSHPDVTTDTSKQPSVAPTPPSDFSATPTVTRTSGPRTRNQSSAVVLSDDDSDDSDGDTNPFYWHAFAAWEIVPTGLGDVNALYFTDRSSKYFTHLREILHLLNRQDLSKLYGMVVKHYEANPIVGAGMMLWGDLHVLFESVEGGSSVEVWVDQKDWVVTSWRLFPFSGVHVLETFSGTVLYMFADTSYPISASTMKKMLKHKLEVEINVYEGCFWRRFQDVAVQSSVPAGSVVPTGKDNSIVSTGSTKVIPAGRTILFLDYFSNDTFRGRSLRSCAKGLTEVWVQISLRLIVAIIVKVKVTWLGSALNQRGQRILTGSKRKFIACQTSQELTTTTIFQTDDLDAFDSDCDEAPSASAVLMAKLSAYDSDYSEQPPFSTDSDIDITSDSNVISYEQYLKETKNAIVHDTTSTAKQDALIMSVIKEMSNQVAQCNAVNKENKTVNESLTTELERYKEQIKNFKERQIFYLSDREKYIDGQIRGVIVDRNAKFDIKKHDALYVIDTEETLKLAIESNLKMHAKQNDPVAKEKKVNIAPIDYAALNKLSEHFAKHFVPKKQLSTE
ncbi:hypothetical protein Tco_0194403 [Tanacetum coccineum]